MRVSLLLLFAVRGVTAVQRQYSEVEEGGIISRTGSKLQVALVRQIKSLRLFLNRVFGAFGIDLPPRLMQLTNEERQHFVEHLFTVCHNLHATPIMAELEPAAVLEEGNTGLFAIW